MMKKASEFLPFLDEPEILFAPRKKFFRINTLKIGLKEFEEFTDLEFSATFLPEVKEYHGRGKLGNSLEYFLGYLHPQSLSSAVASWVLSPRRNWRILDACAAPGSKASHLAALMENRGILVANDSRVVPLISNFSRLGVLNALVTSKDAKRLPWRGIFDAALLDPPCTALSKPGAWKRLSKKTVENLSKVQKKMVLSVFRALKPGGILVYSTCTYTWEENEGVVSSLIQQGAKVEEVSLPGSRPGLGEGELRKCVRLYPGLFGSEGFFLAKVRKVEEEP